LKNPVSQEIRNVIPGIQQKKLLSLLRKIKECKNIVGCIRGETPRPLPKPPAEEFLSWYHLKFKEKTGSPYMRMGKDCNLVKRMQKAFSMEELKRLAEKFLNDGNDPFVKKAGYGLGVFKAVLNRLTSTKEKKPRDSTTTVSGDD